MNLLMKKFIQYCETHSDINEHLSWLHALAFSCKFITEFGTREGLSTTAFLYAEPHTLTCYDIEIHPNCNLLYELRGPTRLSFRRESTLSCDVIAPCDLLFIDTEHNYDQLKAELERHGNQARRYILMHDTETYKLVGDPNTKKGLWPAIEEFLEANPHWLMREHRANNNGMTLLERDAQNMEAAA